MKRDRFNTRRSKEALDAVFSSVAGVVKIAARRYFLRWARHEGEPLLLLCVNEGGADEDAQKEARC